MSLFTKEMNAERARKLSLDGLQARKKEQLEAILKTIEGQAKYGSTGVLDRTVYALEKDTVAELNRRGFAVYVKPKGQYDGVGHEIYVSWGIAGVVPLWVPDWLDKAQAMP